MKNQQNIIKTNYHIIFGLILMLAGCTQKSETETDSSALSPEHLTEKSFLIPETRKGWTTYTAENGLVANHVVGIAVDKDNVKWFGTMGGGVSSFDGTIWKTYTKDEGMHTGKPCCQFGF